MESVLCWSLLMLSSLFDNKGKFFTFSYHLDLAVLEFILQFLVSESAIMNSRQLSQKLTF